MTVEETRNAIDELKAQGLTDDAIAASLYQMYKEDKIDLEQFGALVNVIGYELSDEFKAMSDEEKKAQDVGEFGMSEDDDEEGSDEGSSEDNGEEEEQSSNDDEEQEAASDEDEEEENPFEKNYDKKSDNDDEDEEAKKMYGFR